MTTEYSGTRIRYSENVIKPGIGSLNRCFACTPSRPHCTQTQSINVRAAGHRASLFTLTHVLCGGGGICGRSGYNHSRPNILLLPCRLSGEQADKSLKAQHRQDCALQVGKCLFKVPRRKFEDDSEVFKDMFALPSTDSAGSTAATAEGMSDEHPLILESIDVTEFRTLLRAMFRP